MPIDPAQMIDSIASKQMGVPPEAAPPGAPPQQAAPPQAAATTSVPPSEETDTPTDKATTAGAPADASTAMDNDAILYEVEVGGKKRKLTPQQISSTMERYSALNYKQSQFKPVMDLVEEVMRQNPGATPGDVATHMLALAKAQTNAPQGAKAPAQTDADADNGVDPFEAWEKENAAKLPPGYREMMQGNKGVQSQMQQIQQMLAQVLAASGGVADAARAGQQDARQQQIQAVQTQIANNLDRVQQHLGIDDQHAEDFMTFAAERGYTLEDFVDPRLTLSVMSDFKNNMASPEFERLKQIHQRRQAFTGSMGGTPAAMPSTQQEMQPSPNGKMFDQLANSALAKRNQAL